MKYMDTRARIDAEGLLKIVLVLVVVLLILELVEAIVSFVPVFSRSLIGLLIIVLILLWHLENG